MKTTRTALHRTGSSSSVAPDDDCKRQVKRLKVRLSALARDFPAAPRNPTPSWMAACDNPQKPTQDLSGELARWVGAENTSARWGDGVHELLREFHQGVSDSEDGGVGGPSLRPGGQRDGSRMAPQPRRPRGESRAIVGISLQGQRHDPLYTPAALTPPSRHAWPRVRRRRRGRPQPRTFKFPSKFPGYALSRSPLQPRPWSRT